MNYSHLEIATEVALQIGDMLEDRPRAESRWHLCNIAKRIIDANIINEQTEDIDEVIKAWLSEKEGY